MHCSPKRVAALAVATAIVAALILPAAALAAESYKFSGRGAEAVFDSYEADTDSYVSAFVTGGDFRSFSHTAADGTVRSAQGLTADVYISKWSPGNPRNPFDDVYSDTFGTVSPADITADRSLTAATLRAAIPATSFTYESSRHGDSYTESAATIAVDLAWVGSGPLSKERWSGSFSSDGFTYKSRFSGTRREATVTGSLLLDGEPVGAPFVYGSIFDVRSADVMFD